ncbi:hypothetical protein KR054_003361, partial [Drosophila jambulina]
SYSERVLSPAIVLLFLALFAAVYADQACDPDGNGKPDCTGITNERFRNFWDPTHYWLCNGTAEPVSVQCEISQGFNSKTGKCVPFAEWEWTFPCLD